MNKFTLQILAAGGGGLVDTKKVIIFSVCLVGATKTQDIILYLEDWLRILLVCKLLLMLMNKRNDVEF